MKRLYDIKLVFGILLAGCLLAGCFVPIIYGGYKLYESSTHVGVAINVNKPAPEVYAAVIQSIEKR
jgi:outer membrane murein-binding lipoprotein Lpp